MDLYSVYVAYVDDGHDVLKIHMPARNEEEVIEMVSGSGEVVAVKKLEEWNPFSKIDTEKLERDLKASEWDINQVLIILRLIKNVGLSK